MVYKEKILFLPYSVCAAHVVRPLEIAKALREFGYEILFASGNQYANLIQEAGFEILPIIVESPEQAFRRVRRMDLFGGMVILKQHVDEEIAMIEKLKPDLIITDYRLTLNISAEIIGAKYVSINNAHFTNYTCIKNRKFNLMFKLWSIPYNLYRKRMGLKKVKSVIDMLESPYLNLLVDMPEYSPTKNLPEHFQYIGPIMWEPKGEAQVILEKIALDMPTIYFTMGTSGVKKYILQAAKILADSPYQVIVTTGGQVSKQELPRDFIIQDFAPGSKIMERADIVICHGGNGTVYQALARGLPVIGIPTEFDQERNMDIVSSLGLGIKLSPGRLNKRDLFNALKGIRENPTFQNNAKRFQTILAKYDGPKKGAELIRRYLENLKNENSH